MLRQHTQRKAIFFDRDGTLVEQVNDLHLVSELSLFPDAALATKTAHDLGYLVIIITNQPVVARGIIRLEEVQTINTVLIDQLRSRGGHVDAVYFCPHHPQATIEAFRVACTCRKPAPGMLLNAAKEHTINLSQSFLVGDSTQDIQAGIRAGVTTVLVNTGHKGNDPWHYEGEPHYRVENVYEAINTIRSIAP